MLAIYYILVGRTNVRPAIKQLFGQSLQRSGEKPAFWMSVSPHIYMQYLIIMTNHHFLVDDNETAGVIYS